MYAGRLPGNTVLDTVFQERLQGKAAYEEVLDAVLRPDLPAQAVLVAQLLHLQIQARDLQLILNGDQISRLSQGQPVKTGQISDHLLCRVQAFQADTGLDRAENVVEKMRIDLGLEKLVFQPFF